MSTDDLPLALDPNTLEGLPPVLHRGLIAVSFFGILSLATSSALFIYLTYRLSRWYYQGLLANGANQFLLLIYNLLLADIQQAMAFALTAVYLAEDKIEVGTTTCWANGWFVSTGDLASGVWIFSIALHTFFATVKGRSISNKLFYVWLAFNWVFVYALGLATVLPHRNIYVRAGAWCWVNRQYERQRLWLHYFWIFVAMGGVIVTYALIFISIRAKARGYGRSTSSMQSNDPDPAALSRALKYMIIYPIAYVILTLPLAAGRMAAMTGVKISFGYYCLAGAAITSCGWIDVLLYVMTRRVLVFSHAPPPRDDFGFETLGFKPGGSNFFGTSTVIEGPITHKGKYRRGQRDNFLGARSLRTRHSDEDYFANPPTENAIVTKTTVEVSSGPMPSYDSDFISVIEMEDKPPRTQSPSTTSNSRWPEQVVENQTRTN